MGRLEQVYVNFRFFYSINMFVKIYYYLYNRISHKLPNIKFIQIIFLQK